MKKSMKSNFKTMMSALLAIGLLAAGCARDNTELDNPGNGDGEVSRMVLTVQTVASKGPATRAATGKADPTSSELTLNTNEGLKVAIFTTDGVCEAAYDFPTLTMTGSAGTATAKYTPPAGTPIQLKEGSYYFYVFANDGDDLITLPHKGDSMNAWLNGEVGVYYNPAGLPNIAEADDFLLGTMWKETVTVPKGGTTDEPVELTMPTALGRFSAKIWVSHLTWEAQRPENPALGGYFTAAQYTIGSAAQRMYYVGKVATPGRNNPFTAGTLVTSLLHDAAYNSADFTDFFYPFKDVAMDEYTAEDNRDNVFYVAENTTGRSSIEEGPQNAQFYGNTTYIMLELQYTPAADEIVRYLELDEDGNLKWEYSSSPWTGGPTFWSIGEGSNRKIFGFNPSYNGNEDLHNALLAEGYDVNETREYTMGLCYYHIPVQDVAESDPILRNRVLRNHYYEYIVTKIYDLGSNTSDVGDEEPIEELSNITLTVNVGKWDKVTTGNIEL